MKRVFDAVHGAFHDTTRRSYQVIETVVWVLIVASVLLFAFEMAVGITPFLKTVDWVLLVVFAIEIIIRIGTFRPPELTFYNRSHTHRFWDQVWGRLRFAVRPLMLVDILTVLALVPLLRGLRALRLLRLVRTARVFRYSSPFAGLARSFEENRLLYALALSWVGVVVMLGGLSIWLVDREDPDSTIKTLADGVWWALVTLTTVGYGDMSPNDGVGRLIGGVLMIAGMFTLALFAGVVGQTLLKAVLSVREETFRMSGYIDHVVVCGYDDGSRMLVDSLLEELDTDAHRVVVFAPGDRPPTLPVDATWIQGDPTKESELAKARLDHANAVVVVGGRHQSPQRADANSILTVFTLRRYARSLPNNQRRKPLRIICEILDSENVDHAKTAGSDEVIESNRLGFSLLAHAINEPGTATVLGQVAVPGLQNLYVGHPPEDLVLPGAFSDVARDVHAATDCLVIGVRSGKLELVNPKHDYKVKKTDVLVYIASEAKLPPA